MSDARHSFSDQVCVVVGGSQGLGRHYSLDLARAGAQVVVVSRSDNAATVAEEIKQSGGHAVASIRDARDGEAIVADALRAFGKIDAMVVNAGIIRDRSFAKMSTEEWRDVLSVHLDGAFACAHAIWPHFTERKSGTLLFTSSGAGFHGAFGQANYSTAKAGLIGLTLTLALEGARNNIRVNALAPMADTGMTAEVLSDDFKRALPAEAVSPFALALLHPSCPSTGAIIEAGGGWGAAMRWQRASGIRLGKPDFQTVLEHWGEVTDFSDNPNYPSSTSHSLAAAVGSHIEQEV